MVHKTFGKRLKKTLRRELRIAVGDQRAFNKNQRAARAKGKMLNKELKRNLMEEGEDVSNRIARNFKELKRGFR